MIILNKIISFYYREYKLNLSGFQDILTNIIFFFVSILIFVLSIGPNEEVISLIGTLNIITMTLPSRKFLWFIRFIEDEIEPRQDRIKDPTAKLANK